MQLKTILLTMGMGVQLLHAQSPITSYDRWSVGLFGQQLYDVKFNSRDNLNNGFSGEDMYGMNGDKTHLDLGIGARVKYSASPILSLDLSGTIGSMTGANQVEYYKSEVSFYSLGADVSLLWGGNKSNYRWIPYARFALGVGSYTSTRYFISDDVPFSTTKGNSLATDLGLGVQYYINNRWSLFLQSVYTVVATDAWDGYNYGTGTDQMIRTSFGLSYTFGRGKNLDRKSAFYNEKIDILNSNMANLEEAISNVNSDLQKTKQSVERNDVEIQKIKIVQDSMSAAILAEVERKYFQAQGEKEAKLNLKSVYFDFNSSSLDQESILVLDLLVLANQYNDTIKFQIQGFSDEIGDEESNRKIRFNRVAAVSGYLKSKGIPESSIVIIPWNGIYTGVAKFDRRVEIKLMKK